MQFIAEIGLNHNGNFGLIPELIRQACLSKADIVKFQLGWRDGPGEINQLRSEDIAKIIKLCTYFDIKLMFSIISPDAYDMIREFDLSRYKIASRTVKEHPRLVEKILGEGKDTYISLGFWEQEDLPFGESDNIYYLWCKSLYPTMPWDLDNFPTSFADGPYAGFSDHTIGIETGLLAIARGAGIIEKHFTLDKSDTTIRDHSLSATPNEFRDLVDLGTGIARMIEFGI